MDCLIFLNMSIYLKKTIQILQFPEYLFTYLIFGKSLLQFQLENLFALNAEQNVMRQNVMIEILDHALDLPGTRAHLSLKFDLIFVKQNRIKNLKKVRKLS